MLDIKAAESAEHAEDAVLYKVLGACEAANLRMQVVLDELRRACGCEAWRASSGFRSSQPQQMHGLEAFDDLFGTIKDYPTCWDEAELPSMPDDVRRRVQERLEKIVCGSKRS